MSAVGKAQRSLLLSSLIIDVIVSAFNILAIVSLCIFRGEKILMRKVFWDILKTPLNVGSILGFSVYLLRLPLDKFPPLLSTLDNFSQIATPLLLFILGASFQISSIQAHKLHLFFCIMGRLVIAPFIALVCEKILGFRGVYLADSIGGLWLTLCSIFLRTRPANGRRL